MKNTLILFIAIFTFLACSSNDDVNGNCSETIELLTDGVWLPDNSFNSSQKFTKDGKYFKDGVFNSNWELKDDCITISFDTQLGNISFKIIEITKDKLITNVASFHK
ncbi:hypothetical protein PL373_11535 [Tenacibaculum maritimum]|nr:hypothetical protein [Tenacibaculum maritimum]MDB0601769.1 hypothetical protein [Tenacibaculum maritimum]MDB0610861.1 hypothetical protein [Tenacibaculum maritimum]